MNRIDFFISLFVDWLDCIRSPLITCRRIITSPISDKERLLFVFRIWLVAFLLSLSLEIPIYYYYGIKIESSFLFSYFILNFFMLFFCCFFMHIFLLIFGIKSIFIETLIIYTALIGAYSPFILFLGYPSIFYNVLLVKTIRDKHIDIFNNIGIFIDILKGKNYPISVEIISSFGNLFTLVLLSIIGVLTTYAIIERYNSSKFRTLLSITFYNLSLLPFILPIFIKDIILYLYKN